MDRFVIRKDASEKKDKPDEKNDDKAIVSSKIKSESIRTNICNMDLLDQKTIPRCRFASFVQKVSAMNS